MSLACKNLIFTGMNERGRYKTSFNYGNMAERAEMQTTLSGVTWQKFCGMGFPFTINALDLTTLIIRVISAFPEIEAEGTRK